MNEAGSDKYGIEGSDPMTVKDLIEWLSILGQDGVVFGKDGAPFSPFDDLKICWPSDRRMK